MYLNKVQVVGIFMGWGLLRTTHQFSPLGFLTIWSNFIYGGIFTDYDMRGKPRFTLTPSEDGLFVISFY